MTSLKTSIKTITYLSDTGCLEIQGASLRALLNITLSDGKKLPRGVAIEDSEGNYLTTSVDDGVVFLNNIKPDMVLDIKDEQQSCRIHLTFPEDAPKDVFYETATGECQ
ncbi:hypothetical protein G965_03340 [Escherichia coli UMEA 3318-1]|nr:hypothetical protein G965_03340 [Escherichia coli UMEA 3318-1]